MVLDCYSYRENSQLSEGHELRVTTQPAWAERVKHHLPPGQFGRYLAVGLANTAFGYGTYAAFTLVLTPRLPYAYLFAFMASYFINVTFSFLTYKWLIFKTRGNYLKEWWRCIVVYGGTNLITVVFLPPCVYLLQRFTPSGKFAPYIAGALQMIVVAIVGFSGHKYFSFRSDKSCSIT